MRRLGAAACGRRTKMRWGRAAGCRAACRWRSAGLQSIHGPGWVLLMSSAHVRSILIDVMGLGAGERNRFNHVALFVSDYYEVTACLYIDWIVLRIVLHNGCIKVLMFVIMA